MESEDGVSQLRILSGVLCFISIGAIVAHALVFILLMSHMDAMTVPYSLMGQGVWTGSVTIGTATLLLSYSNAKSKEWIFTDEYGCFTLASSPWFQTVGGITLFGKTLFLLLTGVCAWSIKGRKYPYIIKD